MRLARGLACAGLTLAVLHAGCSKDSVEEARKQGATAGGAGDGAAPHDGTGMGGGSPHASMPGVGGSLGNTTDPNDGNAIPLKLTGLGSAAELGRELVKLQGHEDAAAFERAFRLTFTSDKNKRGYSEAAALLAPFMQKQPPFAAAYRTLAYAKFNMNLSEPAEPVALYEKSVEIDPQYGEAHYAIAFMYTMIDPQKGVEHFKKAMALGVPDERNLGPNFYAQPPQTP